VILSNPFAMTTSASNALNHHSLALPTNQFASVASAWIVLQIITNAAGVVYPASPPDRKQENVAIVIREQTFLLLMVSRPTTPALPPPRSGRVTPNAWMFAVTTAPVTKSASPAAHLSERVAPIVIRDQTMLTTMATSSALISSPTPLSAPMLAHVWFALAIRTQSATTILVATLTLPFATPLQVVAPLASYAQPIRTQTTTLLILVAIVTFLFASPPMALLRAFNVLRAATAPVPLMNSIALPTLVSLRIHVSLKLSAIFLSALPILPPAATFV